MAIVDYDPVTGIKETYNKDASSGKIYIKKEQEVESIFTANSQDRIASGSGWKQDFHKVASIPLIVVEMWTNEMKAAGHKNCNPMHKDNNVWLMAKLNSSDFLKLRTKEGKI